MRVAYYMSNKICDPNNRNDWNIAIMIDFDSFSPRSRSHKGMSFDKLVFVRNASKFEKEQYYNAYRMVFHTYKCWLDFIEDEINIFGKDHPLIADLQEARKKYPLIPNNLGVPDEQLILRFGMHNDKVK